MESYQDSAGRLRRRSFLRGHLGRRELNQIRVVPPFDRIDGVEHCDVDRGKFA
jgi:hypothetical protein